MELVVESQPVFNFDRYDPCLVSILGSSNSVPAEKKNYCPAQKDPRTSVLVRDENVEDEECHMNVEYNVIQDSKKKYKYR
jgi:hypothetical protein